MAPRLRGALRAGALAVLGLGLFGGLSPPAAAQLGACATILANAGRPAPGGRPDDGSAPVRPGIFGEDGRLNPGAVAALLLHPACHLFSAFSQPRACFTCLVMGHVMVVFEQVGRASFELLDEAAIVLLGAGFTLWITIRLARPLLGATEGFSRGGWPEMSHATIRFLIALVLLGGFTAGDTAKTVYESLFAGLLAPLLAGGLYLGQGLMGALIGGSTGANALFAEAARTVVELRDVFGDADIAPRSEDVGRLVDGVMHLVATMHHLARLGFAYGIKYLHAVAAATPSSAVFGTIAGVALIVLFTMFLVTSAIRLVDPLLRVTLSLCVGPLLIAGWVFPWSRQLAHRGLRSLLYAAVYFILTGIVYGLAFQLIVFSLVDLPFCMDTPYRVRVCEAPAAPDFNQLSGGALDLLEVVDVHGNVQLFHIVVWVVTVLFAMALMGLVPQVAGMLTDYRVSDSVGMQVEQQMRGTVMGGVSATAHMVPAGIGLARHMFK